MIYALEASKQTDLISDLSIELTALSILTVLRVQPKTERFARQGLVSPLLTLRTMPLDYQSRRRAADPHVLRVPLFLFVPVFPFLCSRAFIYQTHYISVLLT